MGRTKFSQKMGGGGRVVRLLSLHFNVFCYLRIPILLPFIELSESNRSCWALAERVDNGARPESRAARRGAFFPWLGAELGPQHFSGPFQTSATTTVLSSGTWSQWSRDLGLKAAWLLQSHPA